LPAGLLALAQAFSVAERQLHGLLLNMRRVVSRIYGALFRGSLMHLPYRISGCINCEVNVSNGAQSHIAQVTFRISAL
ncbi:hypothetical protein, partial [Xanthomonas hortorum]|uniref:hypothetical protein n=1 Tax=Xanthomonas hortorum TaxID=56454 RepID=UPI001B8739E0